MQYFLFVRQMCNHWLICKVHEFYHRMRFVVNLLYRFLLRNDSDFSLGAIYVTKHRMSGMCKLFFNFIITAKVFFSIFLYNIVYKVSSENRLSLMLRD